MVIPVFLGRYGALRSWLASHGVSERGSFVVEAGSLGSCTLSSLLTCGLVDHNYNILSYLFYIHQNSSCRTSCRVWLDYLYNFPTSVVLFCGQELSSYCLVISCCCYYENGPSFLHGSSSD